MAEVSKQNRGNNHSVVILALAILATQIGVGIAAAEIISEGRETLAFIMCYIYGMYMGVMWAAVEPSATCKEARRDWDESYAGFLVDWLILIPIAGAFFSSIMIPRAIKARAISA